MFVYYYKKNVFYFFLFSSSFFVFKPSFLLGREGLETSELGLEFRVRPKHFKRGNMKLKCLATIATLYLVSNEESVEGERPQKASVLESRGTAAPSGSRADRVQGEPVLPGVE